MGRFERSKRPSPALSRSIPAPLIGRVETDEFTMDRIVDGLICKSKARADNAGLARVLLGSLRDH